MELVKRGLKKKQVEYFLSVFLWYNLFGDNMKRKYRKYTFEEKLQAAKMHVEEGVGCTTIAKKLNCHKNRILLWSKKYQEGGEKALKYETRGRAKTSGRPRKNFNSIEEELEYVKAERDILKKTSEILKR